MVPDHCNTSLSSTGQTYMVLYCTMGFHMHTPTPKIVPIGKDLKLLSYCLIDTLVSPAAAALLIL